MSAIKKFAGQTAVYGISTVITRFLNFFLTPIYVGLYSPKVYGIFSLMYSWASMLNALLAFGMETTYFRYLNKYENDRQKVYNNTFFTVLLVAFIFMLFTILFVDDIAAWIQKGDQHDPDYASYIKCFIYILVADALAVIPFAKLRADGRSIRYSLIKLVNIMTFIGFNLLFIFVFPLIIKQGWFGAEYLVGWFREGWVGYVFISNLIASLFTLVLLIPELLNLTFTYDLLLVKEMFVYSLPVLIANISFIVNENIDKVFLGQLLPPAVSEQELGIYAACCKIAVFLSIFINAFRLGAEPFFFSHARNKDATETYAQIMNFFIIAVSLIFILLVANIELLKYFIRGKDAAEQALYWSGLKIVPVLLFGYVSLGIYINLSIWYKLSDQTRFGLYISGIGAILTIILNLIFIPKYSYLASAWISLSAYTVMMILSYIWGQRNYPIPYKLRKNIIYLLSSICIVFVAFVVFERNLIIGNTLFIIFTAIVLIVERKDIKLIFGKK